MRQAQKFLQIPLAGNGPQQIAAAHHLGHAHLGIVHHHRKLVGEHAVRAAHDKVPALLRQGLVLGTVCPVYEPDFPLRIARIGDAHAPRRRTDGSARGHLLC